jgi:hypothetical protein
MEVEMIVGASPAGTFGKQVLDNVLAFDGPKTNGAYVEIFTANNRR